MFLKNLRYYFYNVRTANVIWVDMKKHITTDHIAKLDMVTLKAGVFTNHSYEGCINKALEPASNPFPK